MSHLWIDRLRARFEPSHRIGLALGRQHVGWVRVHQTAQGTGIEAIREQTLPAPLFSGQPDPAAINALTGALAELGRDLARQFLPVHVSLPDAAARLAIYELDALPRTRAEQQALARWRLQQEAGAASLVSTSQDLGRDGEQHLLLAMAMSADWQAAIRSALATAGITAWSLSANACRQFNRYHNRLAATSGALVCVSPESWSLLLWDADGRVRYGRSRWRSGADDAAEMAAEVERSIMAYVHGDARRTVTGVYVLAGAAEDALVTALNTRMREPCARLQPLEDLTLGADLDPNRETFPAAVAAALDA